MTGLAVTPLVPLTHLTLLLAFLLGLLVGGLCVAVLAGGREPAELIRSRRRRFRRCGWRVWVHAGGRWRGFP